MFGDKVLSDPAVINKAKSVCEYLLTNGWKDDCEEINRFLNGILDIEELLNSSFKQAKEICIDKLQRELFDDFYKIDKAYDLKISKDEDIKSELKKLMINSLKNDKILLANKINECVEEDMVLDKDIYNEILNSAMFYLEEGNVESFNQLNIYLCNEELSKDRHLIAQYSERYPQLFKLNTNKNTKFNY